eukprot:TRINITY_DN18140_c0_g1_i1.p1 TRINITY_DN18140_c0_g1~~TRINITY_DN18140_c0_g1_i1.p1  ORF type:complete len:912 (+),score=141.26 TRINITY_DN18140_c0_g1_i1:27-2762(+)
MSILYVALYVDETLRASCGALPQQFADRVSLVVRDSHECLATSLTPQLSITAKRFGPIFVVILHSAEYLVPTLLRRFAAAFRTSFAMEELQQMLERIFSEEGTEFSDMQESAPAAQRVLQLDEFLTPATTSSYGGKRLASSEEGRKEMRLMSDDEVLQLGSLHEQQRIVVAQQDATLDALSLSVNRLADYSHNIRCELGKQHRLLLESEEIANSTILHLHHQRSEMVRLSAPQSASPYQMKRASDAFATCLCIPCILSAKCCSWCGGATKDCFRACNHKLRSCKSRPKPLKRRKTDIMDNVFGDLEFIVWKMGSCVLFLWTLQHNWHWARSACRKLVLLPLRLLVIPLQITGMLLAWLWSVVVMLPALILILVLRTKTVELTAEKSEHRELVISNESKLRKTLRCVALLSRTLPLSAVLLLYPPLLFFGVLPALGADLPVSEYNPVWAPDFWLVASYLVFIASFQVLGTMRATAMYLQKRETEQAKQPQGATVPFRWRNPRNWMALVSLVTEFLQLSTFSLKAAQAAMQAGPPPGVPPPPPSKGLATFSEKYAIPAFFFTLADRLYEVNFIVAVLIAAGLVVTVSLCFLHDAFRLEKAKKFGLHSVLPTPEEEAARIAKEREKLRKEFEKECERLKKKSKSSRALLPLDTDDEALRNLKPQEPLPPPPPPRSPTELFFQSFLGSLVYGHSEPKNMNPKIFSIVKLLGDALFFTVASNLLVILSCFDTPDHTLLHTGTVCYSTTQHRIQAAVALVLFGYYVPIAIMIAPSITEADPQKHDVHFVRHFLMLLNVSKVFLLLSAALLSGFSLKVTIAGTASVYLVVFLVTASWVVGHPSLSYPADLHFVNFLKLNSFCCGVLCAIVVLVWLIAGLDYRYSRDVLYAICLVLITLCTLVGCVVWHRLRKSRVCNS